MVQDQSIKNEREKEVLSGKLCEALLKIDILEKSLSGSNEMIKRNDCVASRISQLTHSFRQKSGFGFLDIPTSSNSHKSTFVDQKSLKIESHIASTSSASRMPDNEKRLKPLRRKVTCHFCGEAGHIRPNFFKLKDMTSSGNRSSNVKSNSQRPRFPPPMSSKNSSFNAKYKKDDDDECVAYFVEEAQKLSAMAIDISKMLKGRKLTTM